MRRAFALAILMLTALGAAACGPRVMQAGPPVVSPEMTPTHLRMADGTELPVRVWKPDGAPTAVILALHGFNDYSKAFDRPAQRLTGAGAIVYAYDQRGFGDAPHRGIWPGTDTLTADLRSAAALVKARHPDLPFILMGESMGGAVIITALGSENAPSTDKVVLVAPAVWSRAIMPEWQSTALGIAAHSIPAVQFTGSGLGKMPSDNIDMLREMSRDKKVIKWTRVDAVYGLTNLMDAAYAAAPSLHGPVLILFGEKEDILPKTALSRFERRLPADGCGLRLVSYKSGFHMLLRDLQSETVLTDIAAWMRDPEAPLPSGREKPLPSSVAVAARPDAVLPADKEGDGAAAAHGLNCASSR